MFRHLGNFTKFVALTKEKLLMAGMLPKLQSNKSVMFGHIGALICVIMWGVSFVSSKVLLNYGMTPVEVYINRFIIAYILVALIKPTRLLSQNWVDELLLALCGMLSGSVYFLAENYALEYTLVSNVSLLTSTSPLLTTLLIMILYRSDSPGSGMIIGSLVAFIGVACVIFNSSFDLKINPLGDFLALGAALSWAFYSMLLKKLNANYDVYFITRKTFFYGVLTALPMYLVEPPTFDPIKIVQDWHMLSNLLFLGLGASLVGFLLWAETVKKVGALKANNYMYLQPIVTLIASVILLNEGVSIVGYVGCALILIGLWLGDYLTHGKKMQD